jgi:pimeloyl-ACP methyl ester carboxylesterase
MTYVAEAARLPALIGQRAGSGPALLLLPGLGSTLTEFRAVLPSLIQRYDVLALELSGQGGSPALPTTIPPTVAALTDAVEQELDRRGVAVPHVLGVSLGGRLGLELARRQRARSVVAIGPTGPLTPPERIYQAAMLIASRLAFRAVAPVADTLMVRSCPGRPPSLCCARGRGEPPLTRRRHWSAPSRAPRTSGACWAARSCPRPR